MSYNITVTATTPQGLIDNMTILLATLKAGVGATGEAIKAAAEGVLTAAQRSQIGKDATVVPPKPDAKAEAKAKKEAEAKAKAEAEAAAKAAAEAELEEVDGDATDDALDEPADDVIDEVTREDVHKLLLEAKKAHPANPKIVSDMVGKVGKAKFSEVEDSQLAKLAQIARDYIAKPGKK